MNEDDFMEQLYANSDKSPESCEEDEEQPTLTREDFEQAVERAIWEYENTCDRCGGTGCNYCLMLSY